MNKYLKDIFIHLDGIAMAPIYELLSSRSKTDLAFNLQDEKFYVRHKDEQQNSSINEAYCSILSKILQAQNILETTPIKTNSKKYYNLTDYGKQVFSDKCSYSGFRNYYKSSIELIQNQIPLNDGHFSNAFHNAYLVYLNSTEKNGDESLISKHIEGAIIAPILIYYKYSAPEKLPDLKNIKGEIGDFLKKIDFINKNSLTQKGEYLLSKSYAYGVTDSYMKTFIHIEDLCLNKIRGVAQKIDKDNNEYHVNRPLNVWGSGHSHSTYFKHIDSYVIDIFNKPIDKQPKGIADMGCGDGAFLYHLNKLVKKNTLRGRYLESHPLLLIGADFNQAALDETHKMFLNNKNQPMTVLADISKPDEYAQKVLSKYSLNIKDFLNVRSFLDHNRRFDLNSQNPSLKKYDFKNKTTNVFSWRGVKINNQDIQVNLVEHLKKWKKYISKYGLLVLELHSIDIKNIYNNIGKAPMTAYIATHGFSDQFIIEYEVYKECIEKAGLSINKDYEKTFPNTDIKMISINLIN